MIFIEPLPFEEALEEAAIKRLLPTSLTSDQLMELAPEIRERALFSARTTNATFLQKVGTVVDRILEPRAREDGTTEGLDMASARVMLRDTLQQIDYKPPIGSAEGSITDLSSDQRLNLILKTQADFAHGYGQWKEGQDPDILEVFPAQEFYRLGERDEPRDWPDRWFEVGGEFFSGPSDYPQGRMIALKNSKIWEELSAFGVPYPPFDFNSGMDLQDVDREEAILLGLLSPGDKVKPDTRNFEDDLAIDADQFDADFRQALIESVGDDYYLDAEGVLHTT